MIDIEKFICSLLNRASGLSVIKVIDILDALNNQGLEYKKGKIIPIDNKLKFKVGDWVVNRFGDVWHIDSFDSKNYQVSNGDRYCYFPIEKLDEMHLWTIQDAKNGDVLVDDVGIILFRKIGNEKYAEVVDYHCDLTRGRFEKQEGFEYWGNVIDCTLHPATREQCEQLKKAMADAGYIFDKDLKKIKQEESIEFKRGYKKAIEDTEKWLQFQKYRNVK